ncbi:MAG: polysaccharide biosynthesis/export family protein [Pseudomonadota bacterium]
MNMQGAMAIFMAATLAGCSGLASSGPLRQEIDVVDNANYPKPSHLVIKIDEKVTNITGQYRPQGFSSFFKVSDSQPRIKLAVGDTVNVNIFEAGADGLFSSSSAKATQISAQVDADGQVFVPYVGAIRASGRSPGDLRSTIQAALEDKAIQPQVQVMVGESRANAVTVLGKVNSPGQQQITNAGLSVVDLISLAGGTSGETYESVVTLRRGKTVASANLEDLFDNPDDNVPVRPGDTVLVSDVTRTFSVLGAAATKQEFKFEARKVTLAEGIARAGGLDDSLADARGVFVFRFEPDHIAKALDERAQTAPEGAMVPVVYRINLKDPKSFFLMKLFELRDEDIIYVANHPTAELAKFFQVIAPIISAGTTVASLTRTVSN